MNHIHLPDGVISPVLWVPSFIAVFVMLGFCVKNLKYGNIAKKVPMIGVISALMLVVMSFPLHANLAVLAGILTGPWVVFTAVFIVNLILAMLGHGGITVVGLNTLIVGSQALIGWFLFIVLKERIKPAASAAAATVTALLISTSLMVGIVGVTNAGWESTLMHNHAPDEHHHSEDQGNNEHHITAGEIHDHGNGHNVSPSETRFLFQSGWMALGFMWGLGIVIETLVTVLIVRYFLKVRPEMLKGHS